MFKKNRLLIGVLLSVLLVTTGCGASAPKEGAGASGSSGQSSPVTPEPATTVAQGSADQGKQLFDTTCTSCHAIDDKVVVGPGLKGFFSKSTLLNGKPVNDANVAEWIKMGSTTMPGNPALSEQDLAHLNSYLKTLK